MCGSQRKTCMLARGASVFWVLLVGFDQLVRSASRSKLYSRVGHCTVLWSGTRYPEPANKCTINYPRVPARLSAPALPPLRREVAWWFPPCGARTKTLAPTSNVCGHQRIYLLYGVGTAASRPAKLNLDVHHHMLFCLKRVLICYVLSPRELDYRRGSGTPASLLVTLKFPAPSSTKGQ